VTELRRVAFGVGVSTIVLVALLGAGPVSRETTLAAYAIVLAAIGMASLTRTMRAGRHDDPSPFEHALAHERVPPSRPSELIRVERDLLLGTENAGHFHARLLPLLRGAAAARLASHHGIDLARRPDPARRVLGDELWEYVRPDREEPADLYASGPSVRTVRNLVDRIEAI
jgi:hypothetical protein